MRENGSSRCRAESNADNVGDEAACGAVVVLTEGKMSEVFLMKWSYFQKFMVLDLVPWIHTKVPMGTI